MTPLPTPVRSKRILELVRNRVRQRLPCGDLRVATTLVQRGFLILRDPKRWDMSDSYEITPNGLSALPHQKD